MWSVWLPLPLPPCCWHQPPGLKKNRKNKKWMYHRSSDTTVCQHSYVCFLSNKVAALVGFSLIVRIIFCVRRREFVQKIMEPCGDTHIKRDSRANRQSLRVSTAWPKIFPTSLWWQVHQLYPQVPFLTFHSPKSVLLLRSLWRAPRHFCS